MVSVRLDHEIKHFYYKRKIALDLFTRTYQGQRDVILIICVFKNS